MLYTVIRRNNLNYKIPNASLGAICQAYRVTGLENNTAVLLDIIQAARAKTYGEYVYNAVKAVTVKENDFLPLKNALKNVIILRIG